ncbi:hypothetical protein AB9N12_04555 [Bacteroides sp. AN502(2024)]|uniref:hypothetical protein n=1 Tax=Bacteroides sp. AN502(2024) TaxID=3160599 RepID=UPI003518FBDC
MADNYHKYIPVVQATDLSFYDKQNLNAMQGIVHALFAIWKGCRKRGLTKEKRISIER